MVVKSIYSICLLITGTLIKCVSLFCFRYISDVPRFPSFRKRKLPAFVYRVKYSKDNVAFENPLFDEQSFTYTEHLSWLRARINKLLILDEDSNKKI